MFTNISLLYTGTADESAAVQLVARIAEGLDATADCRFAADPLGVLNAEQRGQYRAMLEMSGFEAAQDFLEETHDARLESAARQAEAAFRTVPGHAPIAWGGALDLARSPDKALGTLGYTHDMVAASFAQPAGLLDQVVTQVLLRAGAPLMLAAHPPRAARLADMTIVFAWKPSAPTKRALRNALPLLRLARRVHLLAIEEEGERAMIPSAQDMADYLMHVHSVATEPVLLKADDFPPGQLAKFYLDMEADLLVMGAYSQSRLRELLFGGFTKRFLRRRDCNLLLAH